MRTFPIEILAVRWLTKKLMQIFKETTTSDESSRADSWDAVLQATESWAGERGYSLKVHTLKKNLPLYNYLSSTLRGTAWPLRFQFASYAYG